MRIFLWPAIVLAALQLDLSLNNGNTGHDRVIDIVKRDEPAMRIDNGPVYLTTNISVNGTDFGVIVDTRFRDTWVPSGNCQAQDDSYEERALYSMQKEYYKTLTRPSTTLDNYDSFIPQGFATPTSYYTTMTTNGQYVDDSTTITYTAREMLRSTSGDDISICTKHGAYPDSGEEQDSFIRELNDRGKESGSFMSADLTVAGHEIENHTIGLIFSSSLEYGTLGLGLGRELTSESNVQNSILQGFKEDGVIQKMAYSLSLGDSQLSILFGAVDHSKYTGELQRVQMLNRWKKYNISNVPLRFEVALNSLSGTDLSVDERIIVELGNSQYVSYLPEPYFSKMGKFLDGKLNIFNYWDVSCDHLKLDEAFTFSFSGKKIKAPVKDFVISSKSGDVCFLAVQEESVTPSLGYSFLKSAYTVYHLEELEISLAQVETGTTSKEIEEIEDEIPKAVRASGYNNTSLDYHMLRYDEGFVSTVADNSRTVSVTTTEDESSGSHRQTTQSSGIGSLSSGGSLGEISSLTKDLSPSQPVGSLLAVLSFLISLICL